MIYLDNAASTEPSNEVYKMFNDYCDVYSNPSSIHSFGREAFGIIDNARKIFRNKLNADQDDQILFTSGATMSNNVFIQGFMNRYPKAALIVSKIEHKDILLLADYLKLHNRDVYYIPVHQDGRICMDVLEDICFKMKKQNKRFLCSIQAANGECGVIQDYIWISKIVHMYGGIYHSDVTQYIPYYPINMECWGIDAISMSGQKIGGIKGSGLLVVRQRLRDHIKPIIYGEQGLIGGTPSTPLIASLGTAFDEIDYDNVSCIKENRDYLLSCLKDMGGILVGTEENRLPNNIYIRFPGVGGLNLMHLLDEQEIYVGTGSACSTDSDIPSHVAKAYGLTDKEAMECVRFTLGEETTYEEIEYVVKVLKGILSLIIH